MKKGAESKPHVMQCVRVSHREPDEGQHQLPSLSRDEVSFLILRNFSKTSPMLLQSAQHETGTKVVTNPASGEVVIGNKAE